MDLEKKSDTILVKSFELYMMMTFTLLDTVNSFSDFGQIYNRKFTTASKLVAMKHVFLRNLCLIKMNVSGRVCVCVDLVIHVIFM